MISYKQKVPSSWQLFLFRETFFNPTFGNTFAFSLEFPELGYVIKRTSANINDCNWFNLEKRAGVVLTLGGYMCCSSQAMAYHLSLNWERRRFLNPVRATTITFQDYAKWSILFDLFGRAFLLRKWINTLETSTYFLN